MNKMRRGGGLFKRALAICALALVAAFAMPFAAEADEAWKSIGDFQVSGGQEGTDYEFKDIDYTRTAKAGTNKLATGNVRSLCVLTSTPITVKNANPAIASNMSIRIEQGVDANVTLAGVNLESAVPLNIVSNQSGTASKLHLTIADGTQNKLVAIADHHAPGLRCGEGAELVVDDGVLNVDVEGNPIVPDLGRIPTGVTFVGSDGVTHTAGTEAGDNRLSLLDSVQAGSLYVKGGYRCAAVGAASFENAGKMTFNGGNISVEAWSNGLDNTTNWDLSDGAGIGSGYAGSGTEMTFNGGTIKARGSYHGSGIGAGMWGHHSPSTAQGDWANRAYPFPDHIDSGISYGDSNTDATKTVAGDIFINGGLLEAYGGYHGNAFGQGCGGWNKGHRIVITGGTLLPDSSAGAGSTTYDIGGAQGEVYVLGGSVRLSGDNKYQALINGQMSTNSAYGSMDGSTTVMMTKINLAGYDTAKNATVTLMDSSINGVPYVYGLPHSTDDQGLLYLWLPTNTNGKEVSVTLGLTGSDGKPIATNPFAISQVTSGSTLKQYADFTIDPAQLDALYSLTKRYDGIAYGATTQGATSFADLANAIVNMNIEVANPSGQHITNANAITFQSQLLNAAGEPAGEAITNGTPIDVGTSQILVTTNEYASNPAFANSFWGHRSYFKAVNITPADAQVSMEGFVIDATGGRVPIVGDHPSAAPGSTFEFVATVAPHYEVADDGTVVADESEAATCAAPTGMVRFYAMWEDAQGAQHEVLLDKATLAPTLDAGGAQATDAHGYRYSMASVSWDPATFASVGLFGGAIPEAFSVVGRYVGADTDSKPQAYYVNYNEAEGDFPGQQGEIGFEGNPVDPADKNIFLQVLHKQDAEAAGRVIAVGSGVSTTVADGPFVLDGRLVDGGGSANAVNPDCTFELCDQGGNPIGTSDVIDVAADGTVVPKASGTVYVRVTKPADGVFTELFQVVSVQVTSASLIVCDRDGNQQRTYLDIAAGGAVLDQLDQTADGGATSGNAWASGAAPAGATFIGWTDDPSTNRLIGVNDVITGTVTVYPVYGNPAGQPGGGTEIDKTVENTTKGDATATPEVNDTLHYAISAHNTNLDGAWRNVMFMDKLPSGVALVEDSVRIVVVEKGPDGDVEVSNAPLAKGDSYSDATYCYRGGVLSYKVASGEGIKKGQSFQVEFDVVIAPEAVGEPVENDASITGDAPDGSGNPDSVVIEGGVTDVAATPDVFDPGAYEQDIVKRGENLTNPDGDRTQVDDRIHYELEMSNTLTAVWKGALFYDKIPLGLTLDVDSITLTTANGVQLPVAPEAYDPETRVLCVHAGDIPYGGHATLAYDVVVNGEAIGVSIANTGYAFDDGSGTSTEPGTPAGEAVPEGGDVPDGSTPSETAWPLPGDEDAEGALPADPEPMVTKSFVNDTHPGSFVEGDILTYKVKLSNAKPDSLWQNVSIRDYMPEGLAFVSGSVTLTLPDGTTKGLDDGVYNESTRMLIVPVGDLAGGETYVLTYKVTLHHGGVNRADASGTLPDDETRTGAPETATPVPDPIKPNQNDDTKVDATDPDTITKTVVNETRDEGFAPEDVLSYTVRLTNPKEGTVWRNVCIFDYLPDGLLYQTGSMTLMYPDRTVKHLEDAYFDEASRTIEVPIDELRGGQTYMLTYRVGLRPSDAGNPVTNVAEVTGTDEPSDPTASLTVQVKDAAPAEVPDTEPKPLDTAGSAKVLAGTSDALAGPGGVVLACAIVSLLVGVASALAACGWRRGIAGFHSRRIRLE